MARRRKQQATAPSRGREFKIRLPDDIARRIERKARDKTWPQNRVIINELADYPDLERLRDLADLVGEMDNTLARYGARISWHDLSDELLSAVDAVLNAQGGALQAAVDRLRVVRNAMLATRKVEK
jgi:hypothetical protein